jgi:TolB-like protein/AraC-like DNA-binding protein/tetratricopeptide (TPR) repeat protein
MAELNQQPFLIELMEVIDRNLPDELFGVSELADAMNMSRSNLLRKVRRETNLSVSQLISQARLKRAMELLKTSQLNVTEVSQQVGFNSTSYFIKCFREYYGYPPGEVNKFAPAEGTATVASANPQPASGATEITSVPLPETIPTSRAFRVKWPWMVAAIVVLAILLTATWKFMQRPDTTKSIAVLPFKNESADSSNVYLINGLMDATLSNLQNIGNLNVVSRTTAEKYRNTTKSIPEMASELNVQYFIEGSGQKLGNRILLNIQLIDARKDSHLWSRQYRRESTDIFSLQQEIASDIAREIQVIITPEELGRIEKKPTQNVEAYENYLQGRENFYKSRHEDLVAAVPFLKKAIDLDPQFALAYSSLVMVYYYLDVFSSDKKYTSDIDDLADKAILYDPKLSEALVAKALSFAQRRRYDLATPYLERALEYSPRSGVVLHFLAEFYNLYEPDPAKYLPIAIKKVKVDAAGDSGTRAFNYFHLSNALMQNGFFKESNHYLEKSLALEPNGFFTRYLKAWVPNLEHRNWKAARAVLQLEYQQSPMRFDILAEIGKTNFMLKDYQEATRCYDSALSMMKRFHMNILRSEYVHIAVAHEHAGDTAKARYYLDQFQDWVDEDQSIYKELNEASLLLQRGRKQEVLDILTRFADTHDYFVYLLLLIDADPTFESVHAEPAFRAAYKKLSDNFWRNHKRLDEEWRSSFENL